MNNRLCCLLVLLASPVVAEPVDNCATVLGSLAVELRIARALPMSRSTSFACPRERQTQALLGASKQRILNSLGPPDATGPSTAGTGGTEWSYFFSAAHSGPPAPGVPRLSFVFDEQPQLISVHCQRTR